MDADTWVQEPVAQIDHNICEDYECRVDQRRPHNHRVIALEDRIHEKFADAGDTEDRLSDHRAGNQVHERWAKHRHNRDEGITHDMPRDHRALTEAFGARGADIILALDLQ